MTRPHPPFCLCPACRAHRDADLRAAILASGKPATPFDLMLLARPGVR